MQMNAKLQGCNICFTSLSLKNTTALINWKHHIQPESMRMQTKNEGAGLNSLMTYMQVYFFLTLACWSILFTLSRTHLPCSILISSPHYLVHFSSSLLKPCVVTVPSDLSLSLFVSWLPSLSPYHPTSKFIWCLNALFTHLVQSLPFCHSALHVPLRLPPLLTSELGRHASGTFRHFHRTTRRSHLFSLDFQHSSSYFAWSSLSFAIHSLLDSFPSRLLPVVPQSPKSQHV